MIIPNFVEERYTYVGLLGKTALVFGVAGVIVVQFVFNSGNNLVLNTVVGFLALAALVSYVLYKIQVPIIKRRALKIKELAEKHGWKYKAFSNKPLVHADMSVSLLVKDDKSRAMQRNVVDAGEWVFGDFLYEFYHRSKSSRWKAGEKAYGVMKTKLPRKMPHVLFDAGGSRGRQFRAMFARSQRVSLEGDFDTYFMAYMPEGYTVDGLAFITPDVMQALVDAKNYDIEIIDDQLYMFAPLTADPQAGIADMAKKLAAIKKQLLDNITTYRDQRIQFEEGRKDVAADAKRLQRSNWPLIVGGIIIAVVIIVQILKFLT